MTITKTAIYVLAGFAAFNARPALAQETSCSGRERVLTQLQKVYGESPIAMGLANNGGIIEVLRSDDRSTFTIVITMPDGTSCLIAAGESWEDLPKSLVKGPRI